MAVLILAIVLAVLGVLTGWLAPAVVHSRRPYGLEGDIGVSVAIMVILGIIEWQWIMPIFDFAGWFDLLASIGDPIGLALIVLWLMRKMNPEEPAVVGAGSAGGADDDAGEAGPE